MEAMDRLIARQSLRLDPVEMTKPANVKTYEDIRRILVDLDPRRNPQQSPLQLSAFMHSMEDSKDVTYRVEATTKSKSKRDIIIEGLDIIKSRMDAASRIAELQEGVEVNGVVMRQAPLGYKPEGSSWVDPLIKQWFGAFRDGIMLCWSLVDGFTYRYDIYQHKLSRIPTDT